MVKMRYDRFEAIRKRHINRVKAVRDEIIERELKAEAGKAAHRTIDQIRAEFEATIKAQEKLYVERLHNRQQKELRQAMLYEIRVTAMQERKYNEQQDQQKRDLTEKQR